MWEWVNSPEGLARVKEDYILIAETDHVLMKYLPNLASPGRAAAHSFGYMHASPRHDFVIKMCWPEGDSTKLQPVGPSPLIIAKEDLKRVATPWRDFAYKLRANDDGGASRVIQDWVRVGLEPCHPSSVAPIAFAGCRRRCSRCGATPSQQRPSACATQSCRRHRHEHRTRIVRTRATAHAFG